MSNRHQPVRCLLVGCGGYGRFLFEGLKKLHSEGLVDLVAGVDPNPSKQTRQLLAESGTRWITDYQQALSEMQPELVILATPIHLHARQSIAALEQGIPVLCEKPAAATSADARAMAFAAHTAGRFCAIGFQWSYSKAITNLKRDIAEGRLGAAQSLSSCVLWARSRNYYKRNNWAGKWTADGVSVGDSILSNATAHHLHNSLFLLGADGQAATPERIHAALGRVHAIETHDTAVVDVWSRGVHIRHCASHAVAVEWQPFIRGVFDHGILHYTPPLGLVFTAHSGKQLVYGDPESDPHRKLRHCVQAVRDGRPIPCPIDCARIHLELIETIGQTIHSAAAPPPEMTYPTEVRDGPGIAVRNLETHLLNCWANGSPPPEWLSQAEAAITPPNG